MNRILPSFCIPTTLACAILSLTGFQQAAAQSLRFAPPIFNVSAASGTTVAANLLNRPSGLAADAAGNLYIADTNNSVVRKVSPTQTATIFAGSLYGYSGDHGPAVNASMKQPSAVAVDAAGNVYISDPGAYAVRKVDIDGVITTFAGGNGSGSSGDGGLASAARLVPAGLATDTFGNIYIVDTFSNSVRVVGTANIIYTYAGGGATLGDASNGGPATAAQLNSPGSLATDSAGNLYIGDSVASNVRLVDRSGIIHPFAGTYLVSGSTGDGGPAVQATLYFPNGIAVDPVGNVYITDSNTVRVINKAGVISTMAGSGATGLVLDGIPADKAPISLPQALAADTVGNLFLAVPSSNKVYRVNLHPEIFPETRVGTSSLPQRLVLENYGTSTIHFSSIAFSGDFGLWSGVLAEPQPCTATGFIHTGYSSWCTLDVVFTPTAEGIRAFPLTITSNDTVTTLTETLSSSALGSALSMTSGQMFIVAGMYSTTGTSGPTATGPAKSIALTEPTGVVVDSSGNIFFSEDGYCLVERVDAITGIQTIYGGTNAIPCLPDNTYTLISGDGGPATSAYVPTPGPLALDSKNNLYISDVFDGRIRAIDTKGNISTFAGSGFGIDISPSCGYTPDGGLAVKALLCGPGSMAFDTAGNLYFVETGNSMVRKISPAGILTTVAGTFNGYYTAGGGYSGDGGPATAARLNQPQGVVVNSGGDVFIADTINSVVRKVSAATGNISTIAGQAGVATYSGDGGPAVRSTLSYPKGLTIDAAGNLFISDYQNWVIRKIDTAGIITTVAGNNLSEGFNGDGLPATESTLSFPNFIFVSPGGHLFISDQDNELIREVSPNGTLTFPATSIGATSASQSFVISNIGNLPLHFDKQAPITVTGDFAVSGEGTCDFTAALAPGTGCSVNVAFTPTAFGARTGILAFTDDGVASPQLVGLSGTGTAPQPQTIHFTAIPNHRYGDVDFSVSATSNSGLPVTLAVQSGNATVSGSTVHISGIGPVTLTADQAGLAGVWLPAAEAAQSFTIAPATLLVTAQNAGSTVGIPLATLTYSVTGFVYNESAAVVTGTPVLTTTATSAGTVGTYPINVTNGTLAASNYTFTFAGGVYTLSPYQIPSPAVKLAATAVITRSSGYTVTVTVANTGTATAQNVIVTTVKLNSIAGSPLPVSLGDIPAGGSVSTKITVPLSAGPSGASGVEQILGTWSGGTFGGTFRVVFPTAAK